MLITRPRLNLSPDQGGASGGTRTDGGNDAGKTTPNADGGSAGKDPQDKGGSESKATDADSDDPAQLKALLAKEREEKAHLLSVHTEMKNKAEERAAAEERNRQENLKKQGEFEKLLTEQTPKYEQAIALVKRQEAVLAEYLAIELKAVPESMQALMPAGDAVDKLSWITKAKAAGALGQPAKAPAKGTDWAPPPGGKGAVMTTDQFNKLMPKEQAAFMKAGGTLSD